MLRVNTTGNVLLRDVGTNGPAAVDTTASVAAKRKFGDTTYSIRATESTIKNIRSLNGAVVQLSKPLGSGITGGLRWDLGGQHFTLSVVKALKLAQGRLAELGASLSEKTQAVTLEAMLKPHRDHRLNATLVAQTKAAIGSYALQHRGFTLTTAHNLAKSATTLTLAKKLGSGHGIKAMYSLRDRAAALEVGKAPITVSVRTKLVHNWPTRPTLGLTINRDVEYRQASPAAKQAAAEADAAPKQAAQMAVGPTKDLSLDERLKALDLLYEKQFAEKGNRKEGGLEVATFRRK